MIKFLFFFNFYQVCFLTYIYSAADIEKLSYEELDSAIDKLYNDGQHNEALLLVKTSRERAKLAFGITDTIYANYTTQLGLLIQNKGQFSASEVLLLEALHIYKNKFGKNHLKYAQTLHYLAVGNNYAGNYRKSEQLFQEAKSIMENMLNKANPSYLRCLSDFAILYRATGRYEQAESLYLDVLTIRRNTLGKNHLDYAASLSNLALLYNDMGRKEEAENLYFEDLKIQSNTIGKINIQYATTLNNLAVLYLNMNKYEKAKPLFLESIEIRGKVSGKHHLLYAASLNNIANLYMKLANYSESESYFLESIKIIANNHGEMHPYYATFLHNLARLYKKMEHYQKAEKLYQEALMLKGKIFGKNHPLYAASLNDLAYLYLEMDQHQDSWFYAHKSISTISQLDLKPKIDQTWFDQIKEVKYSSFQYVNRMEEALACMYQLLSTKHTLINLTKQKMVADLAMHMLKLIRNSYVYDMDKLRLIAKSNDWMLRSLSILDLNKEFNQAFTHVEFHKSVLLLEATKANKAFQLGNLPDSLMYKERLMISDRDDLQAQLLKKRSKNEKDSLRIQLNQLNLQISDFKKQVEQEFPKYAQLKYKNYTASASETQSLLTDNQAIIEYVQSDSLLYIFYIDQQKTKAFKLQVRSDSLKKRIKSFRHLLSSFITPLNEQGHSSHLYIENAYWFYKHLLRPVLEKENDIKHLIIVSDGELGHLPFETFLTEKSASDHINYSNLPYLLLDYSISYQYSASLWKENLPSATSTNNGQIIAMAAHYDSQLDSSILQLRLPAHNRLRSGLGTLPAAHLEVEALANNFEGYFGFDSLATEHEFKKRASQFSIIHLAMHGLLNHQFPTLSSLIFTEDNDSVENNILQAYEISKMELHADLVVLSACQTGYGKFERGNGVASLARAFMYAGVPSLVVSLWQVDDRATAKIMKEFYVGLSKGMNKAEALRQAKLWYIKNAQDAMKHPAYWSPFIQIGNSKPIKIQRKMAYTPWYVGIVVMCLVAGLVFWNRKRIF